MKAPGPIKLVSALFNITADPEERTDLLDDYPKVVARLQSQLDDYYKLNIACNGIQFEIL